MTDQEWAARSLREACERVAAAPEGRRNSTLFKSAVLFSGAVAAGSIDREEVFDAFYRAALACGLGERESSRTINLALSKVDRKAINQCQVCGDEGRLERHHLAPVSVFGDDEAERWPTVMVCVPCHRRWHSLMTGSRK